MPGTWSIGEVATRARLRPSTLRYYEDVGLLPPPERVSGRRRYRPVVLRRLALIRMCQRAGFTLAEVRRLLEGHAEGATASAQWHAFATAKLPELDALVEEVMRLRDAVAACMDCGCMSFAHCRLLAAEPEAEDQSPSGATRRTSQRPSRLSGSM
ncbi:MAG: MerR family transcriptional regulator [Euzebyales bacterium]|nr:MerR family transcriptional regulator [Euzebyales bacterium]